MFYQPCGAGFTDIVPQRHNYILTRYELVLSCRRGQQVMVENLEKGGTAGSTSLL